MSILVSATQRISTISSIIGLRLSNLFLMELIFRYEKMALLWFRILRDFSLAKEFVGCSWVSLVNFSEGTIHSTYARRGREGDKAKAYICCFHDAILLFKGIQGAGGVKITKFERSYFMDGPEGVQSPQGIYKFLKVICQERRTSSI